MKLQILFLTALFSLAGLTGATAQTISGTVTDQSNHDKLVGANIVQVNTTNGTSTDKNGHFELTLQSGKPQAIQVTFIGYQDETIQVENSNQSLEIELTPKPLISGEIFVQALRVDESTPMAYENVSHKEIEKKNLGQDVPYLVNTTPSVVTTSDAGTGIGYTGIRIRGVDSKRINVTINGIPVNDAESHGVFWVDMPDIASSIDNIQIQRGVGTSTNGAGAFGASMNIQTNSVQQNPYGKVTSGVGSFNTRRVNVELGSGLLKNGWEFNGRLSKIASDGYIDRAFSDLKSFYLSATHHSDRSLLQANVFSGKEKTYQAWYGVPESKLNTDRTYNPAGMEKPGGPYDNQTDNYQQDHYQLHYSYQLTDHWNANASLHYTYGRGYYEEYKADQMLANYDLKPMVLPDTTIKQSNLVRRLWLRNDFYGIVFSTNYKKSDRWKLTTGGAYNEYKGDHFGRVIWAEHSASPNSDKQYYFNDAFKSDFNIYSKLRYHFTDALSGYGDLQYRRIRYDFLGKDSQKINGKEQIVDVRQEDILNFVNPKLGLVYRPNKTHRIFASLSVGNKEPTRDEYVNSTPESRPKHETLYDWEAGYKANFRNFYAGVNLYYMDYKNQLILTGQLNDVGAYIRQNVKDSFRAGLELQAGTRIFKGLEWSGNATISRNKINRFTQYTDNYDTGNQESTTYDNVDIAFSPSFIGTSVFDYTVDGLNAELIAKYVSEQYLDNTQSESRKIDPYWVNNLRFSYSWTAVPYLKSIDAALEINNVLDEKYETNGYTYGYISGGSEQHYNYYYPQAGRNFMLQLRLSF